MKLNNTMTEAMKSGYKLCPACKTIQNNDNVKCKKCRYEFKKSKQGFDLGW